MGDGKKIRDYEAILRGCKQMLNGIDALEKAAKAMNTAAASAEATLKDAAGKKDIEAVNGLAEAIDKKAKSAKDSVEELQAKMQREYADFLSLTGGRG